MKNIFICPKCLTQIDKYYCPSCGFSVPKTGMIYYFTNEPDLITTGEGAKYIGYENIGESYMCRRSWVLSDDEYVIPKIVSNIVGGGILLDLGCGDGSITVPCASFGIKIIAGDISCKMLSLLQKLAGANDISLDNVILTRMNALHIPIADNSIDAVIANSMLHVVSAPEKVVNEIYRVLKPGGVFICFDDAPGRSQPDESNIYDNSRIYTIFNYFNSVYWNYLQSKGVKPVQYSWKFDRDAYCMKIFEYKTRQEYEYKSKYTETSLHEYNFPRTKGRGWSNQVSVPDDLHNIAYDLALKSTYEKYGDEVDTVRYREGGEKRKKVIVCYTK